jgi:hypothetical protein
VYVPHGRNEAWIAAANSTASWTLATGVCLEGGGVDFAVLEDLAVLEDGSITGPQPAPAYQQPATCLSRDLLVSLTPQQP